MKLSLFEKTVIIICFLLIIAYLVASFFPKERLWGINHLAYFPLYLRIIIVFLGLLLFTSTINSTILDFFKDKVNSPFFSWIKKHKFGAYIIVSAIFFAIFWVLRTRTYLLGDGYLRAHEASRGIEPKLTEFLDLYLHTISCDFFHQIFNWDAYAVYAFVSCVCGAVFVFFVLLLGDLVGKRGIDKVLIFALLVLSGGSQLFLGYVESYTIAYLGIFIFIYFSIGYLKGKNGLILPFVVFILSVFFHASALYLFPSFIFLLLVKTSNQKGTDIRRIVAQRFFIIILLAVSAIFGFYLFQSYPIKEAGQKLSYFLIPLIGSQENPYSLFSFPHLLDVINQQLLISPVGIGIWIAIFLCMRKRLNFKSAIVRFFLLVTLFSFGFAFLIDPVLGYARDWDLFASTGLGYTVWGAYLVVDFLKGSQKAKHVFFVAIIALLISSLPWFLINADGGRSVKRFENLLGLYQRGKAYGHYTLCWFYYTQGLVQREIDEIKKAIALEKHPRYFARLGLIYSKKGELDESILLYKNAIQIDSTNPDYHEYLGIAYLNKGLFEEAVFELKNAIRMDLNNADFYNNLGIAYFKNDLLEEATFEFKRAIRLKPLNSFYYTNLAEALYEKGDIDEAIEQYEKAKKLHPENPTTHYRLGVSYAQKGLLNKAVLSYKKSLELKPDYVEAGYSLGTILFNTKKTDEAIALFEKALEIRPDFAPAHYALALALARKELKKEAAQHLQQYLDLTEDTTENWKIRGLLEYLKDK